MGRSVDIDDLVGRAEIAERLRVSLGTVKNWPERPGFPAPVLQFGVIFVYLWPEVVAWHKTFERTKSPGGRPPSAQPPAKNPCGVKGCRNTCITDFRGNLKPFCRKHMKQFVWDNDDD